jgi:hypothetical protein
MQIRPSHPNSNIISFKSEVLPRYVGSINTDAAKQAMLVANASVLHSA